MLERLNRAYLTTKTTSGIKIWRKILLIFVLIYGLAAVIDGFGIYYYPKLARLSCKADTALVMGAAQYNGWPSPVFKRRLDKALELLNSGCVSRVVVTGGKLRGDNYSEGFSGAKYLNHLGIDNANIAFEEKSSTSYENLAFARALVPKKEITIITDDYHSYRSRFLARGLGYKVEIAPVFHKRLNLQSVVSELAKLTAYHLGIIR